MEQRFVNIPNEEPRPTLAHGGTIPAIITLSLRLGIEGSTEDLLFEDIHIASKDD